MRFRTSFILISLLLVCGCVISPSGIAFQWPNANHQSHAIETPDAKIVGHEFRCLIIEDASQHKSLTSSQLAMMVGQNTRNFLKANCVKDTSGNPEHRLVDKDAQLTGVWADMKSSHSPASYPWVILTNGTQGTGFALPNSGDVAADWAVLKGYFDKYSGAN